MISNHSNDNYVSSFKDQSTGGSLTLLPLGASSITPELSSFLRKPVTISRGTINDFTPGGYQFANLFFADRAVREKIKYFSLVRGTFVINITISGVPTAVGYTLAAVKRGALTSNQLAPVSTRNTLSHLFTCDHAVLDMANPTVTIKVPVANRLPYLDVTSDTVTELSTYWLYLVNLIPYVSTLDGTSDAVSYKITVNLEDEELSIPTVYGTAAIYTSENVQASTAGMVSGPATIVHNVAAELSKVPLLGPFAMATSMAAGAVADIATLFGFSRPIDLAARNYPHEEDFASFVGLSRVKTLTLDPQQEVCLDNTHVGEQVDNLSFAAIIKRPGLVQYSSHILDTAAVGSILFRIPASPNLALCEDTDWTTSNKQCIQLTPLAYVTQLFALSRGTIRFRIRVPANSYCRGKIRFFYSPILIPLAEFPGNYSALVQTTSSVVLDLNASKEIVLDVPSTWNVPYNAVSLPNSTTGTNGFIYGIVDEPIAQQAPNFTYYFIVTHEALDDFRFYLPHSNAIQAWRKQYDGDFATNPTTLVGPTAANASTQNSYASGFTAQPNTTSQAFAVYTSADATEDLDVVQETMLPKPRVDAFSAYHMGEEFISLRPALKRFYPYSFLLTTQAVGYSRMWFIPYKLWEPLMTDAGAGTINMPSNWNHPVQWVCSLYWGSRGSMRYYINTKVDMKAYRFFGTPHTMYGSFSTKDYLSWEAAAGMGEAIAARAVGETAVFQLPYQGVSNYIPNDTAAIPSYATQYGIVLGPAHPQSDVLTNGDTVYASIGEDFNCTVWNGVPLMWYQFPHA